MAYITKKTTRNGVKPIGSNLFGLCSTASATAQKSVSMSDFNVLVSGVTIHVYFAYANTAQNPTLSVGSTAGVAIKRNGVLGGKWSNGSVISFTYDGTNWIQNDADDGSESITYGLSLNGNQLSLVEGGTSQSVTLTDEDTTYSLSINGNVLTLTDSDGNHDDVTLPSGTDTTYTISISGHTLTLTPSSGTPQSVTLPDNDTKYGLSLSGNTISLVENGGSQSITITDENTTYTISISGHTITLTPSEGTAQTITVPDTNTTYSMSISGQSLELTASDGTTYTVTLPDNDTKYGLSLNGNQLSLVEGGTTQSVTLTDENTTYTLSLNGSVLTLTDSSGNHDDVTLPGADVFYPIGSYLETSDSLFDPNTAFGGTWVSETIKDEHIVDQGTTSGWTWKKWSSGRYEAERTINYGQVTAATVLATIEGNLKLFISTAIPANVPSPPHTLTSGTIEYEYLGNGLGYSFIFRTTQNKIQIGRLGVSSSETAFSNVMLLYRVVGGLWKTYVAPTTIYRWHRTA